MCQVLGLIWAAGFHPFTGRSSLTRVLKLINLIYFFKFSIFFSGRVEPWTPNQWMRDDTYFKKFIYLVILQKLLLWVCKLYSILKG
jgi:hypothetical protein